MYYSYKTIEKHLLFIINILIDNQYLGLIHTNSIKNINNS